MTAPPASDGFRPRVRLQEASLAEGSRHSARRGVTRPGKTSLSPARRHSAIAAGGGAVGLLLGGLLTEYLDWRWCLYVNIPIAIVAAVGAQVLLREARSTARRRLDVRGAALVSLGLVSVVYGCSEAESHGWSSAKVVSLLVLGAVLIAGFVAVESRISQPLLPLRVVLDRTRASACLAVGLSVIGMFGAFLFFTYQMQIVMHYSPVLTGLAFLPMTGAILISAGGIASRLIAKVPPRTLMVPGLLIAASGLFWASRLQADSSYVSVILPVELLLGFGMGWVMAPAMNYATHRVGPEDAGVASATVNTAQQIGASIGTALLNTIATSGAASYLASHAPSPSARPAALAAVVVATAALIVALLMDTPRPRRDVDTQAAAVPAGVR